MPGPSSVIVCRLFVQEVFRAIRSLDFHNNFHVALTSGRIILYFLGPSQKPHFLQEELHLNPNLHEVGSWMYLYRYAHHLYQYFEPCHENSKNMLSSQMVLNLGVSVAKLARKQVNTRLIRVLFAKGAKNRFVIILFV